MLNTISVMIAGESDFGVAMTKATNQYDATVRDTIRENPNAKVSLSHSSGFVPGHGFFVNIIATVIQ